MDSVVCSFGDATFYASGQGIFLDPDTSKFWCDSLRSVKDD